MAFVVVVAFSFGWRFDFADPFLVSGDLGDNGDVGDVGVDGDVGHFWNRN